MKKHIWISVFLLPLFFTSCNLSGESNYTPSIYFIKPPVVNGQDTLKISSADESGLFLMDTIKVGDTVKFVLRLEGYANKLTYFSLKHTPANAAKLILPPVSKMDSLFKSNSDYEKGDFYMDPLHSTLFFVFDYVAVEPSTDAKLDLQLTSDAKFKNGFGSNVATIKFKTPINP